MRNRSRRGATTVEMAMVGIPIMFIVICVFEISRGMWMYHTLSYAAKNGVRFAIVHGINCVQTTGNTPPGSDPNSCYTTIGAANGSVSALATIIQNAAVGPDPSVTKVTFTAGNVGNTTSTSCYLAASATNPYGSLQACSTYTARWPPDNYNSVGTPIEIDIETPFHSALSMFWPGNSPMKFNTVNLFASSKDYIQF